MAIGRGFPFFMVKKYFDYKWYALHLNTECYKCGNNIVLQDFEGSPTCNECGSVDKMSWASVIKKANVASLQKGGGYQQKMMGTVNANASTELVEKITCYHCKAELKITETEDLNVYHCESCNNPVAFHEYEDVKGLLFYRNRSATMGMAPTQMIAVRCVSCGAPLEADPTKSTFHCKFCTTDNVLPASMRYKIVLDDIYITERRGKLPKLSMFEQDGKAIEQVLRENGKASFADKELDQLLLEKKDDAGVYHIVINEYKYLPPDKILREIFTTSQNPQIIQLAGNRLQIVQHEIDDRIQQVNPGYKKTKKVVAKDQAKKTSSNVFTLSRIIMFVTFAIVAVVLLYTFGII